nr:hypothetical protein [uncultured Butyrivibrio sp.]
MAMTYEQLKSMDTFTFITWLDETFVVSIPQAIITTEDMEKAAKILLRLSSEFAYISQLLTWFKAATRDAKRNESKEEYEDMVDKRDAVEGKLNAIKQSYAGVSRAVTIRTENNMELRMAGTR